MPLAVELTPDDLRDIDAAASEITAAGGAVSRDSRAPDGPLNYWLVCRVAILAGGIAAVSGFGIGSFLTPLLILFMPADSAVAVLALPHAWATCLRLWRLRGDIDWPTFRQFGIASAVGGLAGALLQARLASPVLTVLLAVLLLLAGSAELLRRPLPVPNGPAWRLGGGLLSGLFGGLVGNQGGIRAAALLGFHLSPRAIVATATASALLVDAARVPVYLVTQGPAHFRGAGARARNSARGDHRDISRRPILSRIPATQYRRILGALLCALGALLLLLAATRI